MKATLNLRFDKSTIEAAKENAQKQGTSVSAMVESYLKKLSRPVKKKRFVSDGLIGILKEYEDYSDEELEELYLKGKHDA